MSSRNQKVISEVERQLMTNKQQTKAAIKEMVEIYVVKKLSEYEKVLKAFGKFFNSDELQR
jgi:nucleoid DNA-binding protein